VERRPSLLQLFKRDCLSRVMVIFSGGFALALQVVAFARGPVTGEYDPVFSGIFAAAAGLVLLACGCWALCRLLRLRQLLAEGARVTGEVLRIDSAVEGGWYTLFGYCLDGWPSRVVIGSPSKPRHQLGDVVPLVVDRRKPSRAILEETYSETALARR
jgi:hypothetical protein